MPSLVITKNLSRQEIAQLVADNYTSYYFEEFLHDVYSKTEISNRVKMVNSCKSFANNAFKHSQIRGTVFCLTGDFNLGKRYWQRTITDKGGIVKSSVTNSVNYLVIDNGKMDGTSSIKQKEAKKLGIPIIHVSELKNFS